MALTHLWNAVKMLSYANNANIVYKQTLINFMVMLQLIAYRKKWHNQIYILKICKFNVVSALVVRFITRRYIGEYDPTLEKLYTFNTLIDSEMACLEILDTAGQPHVSVSFNLSVRSHRCSFRIHLLAQGERKRIISFERFFLCFSQRKWSVPAWRQTSGGRMCLFWCTRWQISAPLTSVHASSSSSTTTKEGGDSLPPGSVFFSFFYYYYSLLVAAQMFVRALLCGV